MKTIDIPEDCFAGFDDSHRLLTFEVDSSIDQTYINRYLSMLSVNDKSLGRYQFDTLIGLLNESAYYGHNVNNLLKIAYCGGNRQVIHEHHLMPINESSS